MFYKMKASSNIFTRLFIAIFFSSLISCNNKQTDPGETYPSQTKLETLPAELANVKTSDKALKALQEGFGRYKNGQFKHIHIKRVTDQQDEEPDPFVAIISCSD